VRAPSVRAVLQAAPQVAAGAQVLLTQPPLDWGAWDAWLQDAARRGVTSRARLLVGFPCLSSAANASFWAALCGARHNAAVRAQCVQRQHARAGLCLHERCVCKRD
jgi:5,10-methylenetetrahydrofolate reductase